MLTQNTQRQAEEAMAIFRDHDLTILSRRRPKHDRRQSPTMQQRQYLMQLSKTAETYHNLTNRKMKKTAIKLSILLLVLLQHPIEASEPFKLGGLLIDSTDSVTLSPEVQTEMGTRQMAT